MLAVKVLSLDPSLRNFAIVRGLIDLDDLSIFIRAKQTILTEKETGKKVRSSSDDLRCAQEIVTTLNSEIAAYGAKFLITEVPSGAQSARAAFGLGIVVGILGSITVPIIQVNPIQTKMVSIGRKNASKREIIEWAYARYPDLGWERYDRDTYSPAKKGKPRELLHHKGDLHDNNEHEADAIAVLHAGVRTPEFQQARALMRSIQPSETVS